MTPPPTARIPINKIQLGDTQTRVAIDLGTVNRYAELMADGVNLPPVDIYVDEHGVHWLADGYHRIEAAESCGKTEIDATIHTGSRDDALWAALAANRTHGLPMSRDDKRNAVEMALRAFLGKSNREIGRQVGCGDQLVARVRETLESNRVITQLDKTVSSYASFPSAIRPSLRSPWRLPSWLRTWRGRRGGQAVRLRCSSLPRIVAGEIYDEETAR